MISGRGRTVNRESPSACGVPAATTCAMTCALCPEGHKWRVLAATWTASTRRNRQIGSRIRVVRACPLSQIRKTGKTTCTAVARAQGGRVPVWDRSA
jgi:hypothetical protein